MPLANVAVDAGQTAHPQGRPLLCSHPGAERHAPGDGCQHLLEKVPVNTRVQHGGPDVRPRASGTLLALLPLSIATRWSTGRDHRFAGLGVDRELLATWKGNPRPGTRH